MSVVSTFWLVLWASFVSLGWLLPNHYPPWSTFHLDAWMACAMLPVALWVTVKVTKPVVWTGLSLLVVAFMWMPALQYAVGLVTEAGNAWVSTAYLLGFLLALLTGARWEAVSRGQLADGLFLAIGIAALISVGLQLHQWLLLERLDIWSMGGGSARPFANLGQPNQLGTLLLWGLLAVAWGYVRRQIGAKVAMICMFYLLFGVALTASRTAWVALLLLAGAAWFWRQHWPSHRGPWMVVVMVAFFVACVLSINPLAQALLGGATPEAVDIVRIAGESRPAIWALFLEAAMQRPWMGYGWNQVAMAQMAVAVDHPALHVYFSHSHNLFLDLVLWCGLPLGATVSAYLLWWMGSRAWRVRNAEEALLFLLLLVAANHAMLELPLHHAYFLLPVGLVMGALDVRIGIRSMFVTARWVLVGLWLACSTLLGLIGYDYLRVEAVYQNLRFEWADIKTPPAVPPNVFLLSQWRDYVTLAKWDLDKEVSDADLVWMERVTSLHPNTGFFQVLARALAKRGESERAAHWLKVMCNVLSEPQCAQVKNVWTQQARRNPSMAAVPWPDDVRR